MTRGKHFRKRRKRWIVIPLGGGFFLRARKVKQYTVTARNGQGNPLAVEWTAAPIGNGLIREGFAEPPSIESLLAECGMIKSVTKPP